jgi:hypothetical protein
LRQWVCGRDAELVSLRCVWVMDVRLSSRLFVTPIADSVRRMINESNMSCDVVADALRLCGALTRL